MYLCCYRHEIALGLQEEEMRQRTSIDDGDGTSLQALQTPQQQRSQSTQPSHDQQSTLITNIAPQTSDPLGVVDSTLMAAQQYLPSASDEIDENRTDAIIQEGQFTLNNQVLSFFNCGAIAGCNCCNACVLASITHCGVQL